MCTYRKRPELVSAFKACDTTQSGKVTIPEWAGIMAKVTGVMINWGDLLPLLGVGPEQTVNGDINYNAFIDDLRADLQKLSQVGSEDSEVLLNAMYANRNTLECVFAFFDTNGDGVISKEEFHNGCAILNKRLPKSQQITNPARILEVMDIDGNDGIDINEFFEVFRIVDAADGSVDGKMSIIEGSAAEEGKKSNT